MKHVLGVMILLLSTVTLLKGIMDRSLALSVLALALVFVARRVLGPALDHAPFRRKPRGYKGGRPA